MVTMAGDDFEQTMESLVVRRVFASPTPWLPSESRPEEKILGVRSPVPIDLHAGLDELPIWLPPAAPGIWTHGSRYAHQSR